MFRKISVCLAALIIFCAAGALFVSADSPAVIDISGNTLVKAGDSVTYSISVKDITAENGIVGADICLSFDPDVLQYVSNSAGAVNGWQMDANTKEAGKGLIELHPADSVASDGSTNGVSESGRIKYDITFRVLETEQAETLLKVDDATVTPGSLENDPVKVGTGVSLSIRIKHFLQVPQNPAWDGGTAVWDAVDMASKYSVQLYKGGKEFGSAYEAAGNSLDLSSLSEAGRYTFTVTALSESEELGDSEASSQSGERIVKGALAAPSAKLTPDIAAGGLRYQITDTNPDGSVAGYTVTLYDANGEVVATEETTSKAGDFPLGENVRGGEKYSVTVSAKPSDAEIYENSPESARSGEVAAAKLVSSIAYGTAPATTYTEGAALNLTGVTVVLTYSDGTTETVAYSDFEKYGITLSEQNGKKLSVSDTGMTIVASFGSGSGRKTATSARITVNSSDCAHANTHIERKEPTCGASGYENVVCDDCGETLSVTEIPATGLHTFGDWVITVNPTSTLKGIRTRTCTVCGQYETEDIAPVGTTANGNTDPSSTTAPGGNTSSEPATDPPAVTDRPGKTNDISKIFLVALIVIFIIIIIIIILSILAERKRERERKRRAAQRRKRSGQ